MSSLQRRRGSSTRLSLFIPSTSCPDNMDFSVATRSILEGVVLHWAKKEELSLDPIEFCLEGVRVEQGPWFLAHIVTVINAQSESFRPRLEQAAAQILATHETRDGYFKALTDFLDSSRPPSAVSNSSSSSRLLPEAPSCAPGDLITRKEVLILIALCAHVALEFVRTKQEEALLHCLTWSTEFLTDCSPVAAWVQSRGGWACAFQYKTPHIGFGTVGIIASFVCFVAFIIFTKR